MTLPGGNNPYTVLSSELLHKRPYVRFYKDRVHVREVDKDYSYIDVDESVGILALNENDEVALVGQWRYPLKKYCWEIPAGMCEPDATSLENAKRELLEEAGVTAKEWREIGSYHMDGSKMNQTNHLFLARGLNVGENAPMEDEKITVVWLPLSEAIQKMNDGEIRDGFTVIALLKAQAYLRNSESRHP